MTDIDVIMHKIMLSRAGRSDAALDDICEAYYELRRAKRREEAPENPVVLEHHADGGCSRSFAAVEFSSKAP